MKKEISDHNKSGSKCGLADTPGFRTRTRLFSLILITGMLAALCWVAYALKGVHQNTEFTEVIPRPVKKAWEKVDEHLAQDKIQQHFGGSLPTSIVATVTANVRGHFSIYVEELRTGRWWGVNEQDSYDGGNLLKVSMLVTLLKKMEREQLSLDNKVVLCQTEKRNDSPTVPRASDEERLVSIKILVERMIRYSDDAAAITVCGLVSFDDFQEGLKATGLPLALSPNQLPHVTPKQYANLLRSLFFSNYLEKSSSELVLSLLSNTIYTNRLRAGVPEKIMVAHKVGSISGLGDSHDCGIIFLPKRPYILCVMSTNTTKEESDRIISAVSRQVYEFMDTDMPVAFNF